jgi:hypothetical protein
MPERVRSGDVILILSALVIAYSIWLVAKMSNVEDEIVLGVPVALDLPPYIEADVGGRRTVSIEVRYPKSQRRDVHSGSFEVVVDDPDLLNQAGVDNPNPVTVPLMPEDVQRPNLPSSVQVARVDPSRLTIYVKYRTLRAVIVPTIQGRPAPGYRVERAIVETRGRLLTGAPEQLNRAREPNSTTVTLGTNPISVAGARDPITTTVAIRLPPGLQILNEQTRRTIPPEHSYAEVRVLIREEAATRTVRNVPIVVPTLTRGLIARTVPSSGSVTVAGPRSAVEQLDRTAVQLKPKEPPEESPGFVGEIALEARLSESAPTSVTIAAFQPGVALLRYETRAEDATATPPTAP